MKIAGELESLVRKYLINKKYIVLIFKFSGERDEIHAKFSSAIIEMQQKSSLKYMILEIHIFNLHPCIEIELCSKLFH